MGFYHVGQAGLELLTLGVCPLGLPKCRDYRREVSCLGLFCFFSLATTSSSATQKTGMARWLEPGRSTLQ